MTIKSAVIAAVVVGSSNLRFHPGLGSPRICRRRAGGCPRLQRVKLFRYSVLGPITQRCHLTPQRRKFPSQSYSEQYFRRIPQGRPLILPGNSFDLLRLHLQTSYRWVSYESLWHLSGHAYEDSHPRPDPESLQLRRPPRWSWQRMPEMRCC